MEAGSNNLSYNKYCKFKHVHSLPLKWNCFQRQPLVSIRYPPLSCNYWYSRIGSLYWPCCVTIDIEEFLVTLCQYLIWTDVLHLTFFLQNKFWKTLAQFIGAGFPFLICDIKFWLTLGQAHFFIWWRFILNFHVMTIIKKCT